MGSDAVRRVQVSVVIPVYNSEAVVGHTVQGICRVLEDLVASFEIVLVDDGSADGSWDVVRRMAECDDRVVAMKMVKNYGQHNANLAGMRASTGSWVVTMDDDGQNPADELPVLLNTAERGHHDVVFGRFREKAATRTRTLGSWMVGWINTRVFSKPHGLTVSNFRIIRRDVVDRICADPTRFPYITGQALLYSSNPGNVDVDHMARAVGESNYSLRRILRLVLRILFSYSVVPLHIVAGIGSVVALASLVAGGVALIRGFLGQVQVEGWTTIVVLVSFLQGVTLLILAMLGEYVVRTLTQVSDRPTYLVSEVVDGR